jgi:hypothetical protein
MDMLQDIPWGTVLLIGGGLCIVGIVIIVILNFFGAALGIVGNLFEFVFDLLGGGPLSWCGCLIGLFVIGGCICTIALSASVLTTCGTAQAVRFCTLFGR